MLPTEIRSKFGIQSTRLTTYEQNVIVSIALATLAEEEAKFWLFCCSFNPSGNTASTVSNIISSLVCASHSIHLCLFCLTRHRGDRRRHRSEDQDARATSSLTPNTVIRPSFDIYGTLCSDGDSDGVVHRQHTISATTSRRPSQRWATTNCIIHEYHPYAHTVYWCTAPYRTALPSLNIYNAVDERRRFLLFMHAESRCGLTARSPASARSVQCQCCTSRVAIVDSQAQPRWRRGEPKQSMDWLIFV